MTADTKLAKASCDSLSGNPNDICMAGAKGDEKIALAESQAEAEVRAAAAEAAKADGKKGAAKSGGAP